MPCKCRLSPKTPHFCDDCGEVYFPDQETLDLQVRIAELEKQVGLAQEEACVNLAHFTYAQNGCSFLRKALEEIVEITIQDYSEVLLDEIDGIAREALR